jgi:hypothetical protein
MTDQKPGDDVVRMDRVQMFIDRPLWYLVLMTPVQGILALIRSKPEPVVVVMQDDVEEARFSLPLFAGSVLRPPLRANGDPFGRRHRLPAGLRREAQDSRLHRPVR